GARGARPRGAGKPPADRGAPATAPSSGSRSNAGRSRASRTSTPARRDARGRTASSRSDRTARRRHSPTARAGVRPRRSAPCTRPPPLRGSDTGDRTRGSGSDPSGGARRVPARPRPFARRGRRPASPSPSSMRPSTIGGMKTVAVIGASSNRRKFGTKALRAFEHRGYHVIPITPHEAEVEGHKAYSSVLDVPGPIDMATVYVPGAVGLKVMDDLAQKGIHEVWLNPGADDRPVVDRARTLGLKTVVACSIIG